MIKKLLLLVLLLAPSLVSAQDDPNLLPEPKIIIPAVPEGQVQALGLVAPATIEAPRPFGEVLVPIEQATHKAIKNGDWVSADTWDCGVPGAGAKVLIPAEFSVMLATQTAELTWLRLEGRLYGHRNCNCEVGVNTRLLYTGMMSDFEFGTPGSPVKGSFYLKTLAGTFGPEDFDKKGGGAIIHGHWSLCGLEKTPYDNVAEEVKAGTTTVKLRNVPYGWKVGDEIAVTGTDTVKGEDQSNHRQQDEYRTITALKGRTVTVNAPFLYRHVQWDPDPAFAFQCANLTRNVRVFSANPNGDNRGHLMFHSSDNIMVDVEFADLGRTNKKLQMTHPYIDPQTQTWAAGSNANPVGRYMDHVHRAGPLNPPSIRIRCVYKRSPGWGLVNHASNCQWMSCVGTQCDGSAFVTEEGQERGWMRHCLAFHNQGLGALMPTSGTDDDHGDGSAADFGKDGSGFWLHSGLVEVSNCISCNNTGRGFGLFLRTVNGFPNMYYGMPARLSFPIVHDRSLLSEEYDVLSPGVFTYYKGIPASSVPYQIFDKNTAYNNKLGIQGWSGPTYDGSSQLIWPITVRGNITNFTTWGSGNQVHLEYMRQVNIRNYRCLGDGQYRGEMARWVSSNAEMPLNLRSPEITIWGVDIKNMYTKEGWATKTPRPIYTDNNIELPPGGSINHKFTGGYPVVDRNGNPITLPVP